MDYLLDDNDRCGRFTTGALRRVASVTQRGSDAAALLVRYLSTCSDGSAGLRHWWLVTDSDPHQWDGWALPKVPNYVRWKPAGNLADS